MNKFVLKCLFITIKNGFETIEYVSMAINLGKLNLTDAYSVALAGSFVSPSPAPVSVAAFLSSPFSLSSLFLSFSLSFLSFRSFLLSGDGVLDLDGRSLGDLDGLRSPRRRLRRCGDLDRLLADNRKQNQPRAENSSLEYIRNERLDLSMLILMVSVVGTVGNHRIIYYQDTPFEIRPVHLERITLK